MGRAERVCLEAGLLLTLAFATWSHGAVAAAPRVAATVALGMLATLALARCGRLRDGCPLTLGATGVAVCGLLLLCAIGALHAPYAHDAVAHLCVWLAAGAAYLVTMMLSSHRRSLRRLKLGLVLLGSSAAIPVLIGESGPQGGPFVNPNHLAALLAATLPLAVACMAVAGHEERRSGIVFAHAGAAVVCLLGLLATQSRGGILAGIGGVLFVVTLIALGRVHAKAHRWGAALALLLTMAAALWLAHSVVEKGLTRFRAADPGSESSAGLRASIWQSALGAAAEGGPLGWGLGSFRWVYPAYRGVDVPYSVSHAHNDWLEGTVELGWVFPILCAGAALTLLSRALATRSASESRLLAGAVVGGTAGLAALVVHAFVDFPFQIPSIAWTAAVLAGLSGATSNAPQNAHACKRIGVSHRGLAALGCGIATIVFGIAGGREVIARAWGERAEVALEQLDLKNAEAHARRAVAIDPGLAESREILGRTLIEISRFGGGGRRALDAARASLVEALRLNPRDAGTWLEAGLLAEAMGDKRGADTDYRRAVSLDPRSVPTREAQAAFLLRHGSQREALATLRIAAESDARALPRVLDQLWNATHDPETLAEVTPSDVRSQLTLGDYLDNRGLPSRARAAWNSAAKLASRDAAPAVRMVRLSLREGDVAGAVEEARAALDRGANGSDLHKTYASALALAGRLEEAAQVYRALFKADPASTDAARALADIEQRLGHPEEAVGLWKAVVRATPGDLSVRLELARAYRASGHWSSAVETCRAALAADPLQEGCRLLLVDLYTERDRYSAAEAVLREWLAIQPSKISALKRMAKLYESMNRWPEAREHYQRVLTLDPENTDARVALAHRASDGGLP